jgi:hypothetical protein
MLHARVLAFSAVAHSVPLAFWSSRTYLFFFPQLFSSFLAAQQQRLEEGVSFGWAVQPLWCGLVSVYLHTRHGRAARERLTDCYVHSLLAVLLVISSLLHQKEISELWNARLMELRNRTKCLSSMFC